MLTKIIFSSQGSPVALRVLEQELSVSRSEVEDLREKAESQPRPEQMTEEINALRKEVSFLWGGFC